MHLTRINLFNSTILPGRYYYYLHTHKKMEHKEGEDLKRAVKVTANEG